MLTNEQRIFVNAHRVARLATADGGGAPHALPVCFALSGASLYIGIDEKPKQPGARPLKRIRNILENPRAAIIVDRYKNDWEQLGWVMLRGTAEILNECPEQIQAHGLLRERYSQYRAMYLEPLPVIALRIERVTSWGNLTIGAADP